MFSGTYLFADIPVRIFSLYEEVQSMCADYRTEQEAEVVVTTTEEEIAEEDRLSDEQRELEGLPPYHFTNSYLETLTVYRKIALAFLERNVLLMHGSVVAVDGLAYMFTALSGTGKSTHVRLWRNLFGKRAVMVNDDKPLVRIEEGRPIVYGTPWDGKHHLSNNIAVPLKAIVVLRRGVENEIHALTAQEAFPTLLQQSFRTEDPLVTIRTMQLLSMLAKHVGLYELHCNMDSEAAEVAYRGMNK